MDCLAALDIGQRTQPVAINRRQLEILLLGRFGHLLAEPSLNAGRFAREEQLRVRDQLRIILLADPTHARRRTAADLVEQAGPGPVREKAVGTTP